jgi:hypothetical protein
VKKADQVQQLLTYANWLAAGEEENLKIMTDEEIINTTTARMSKSQVLHRLSAQYFTMMP